MIDALVAAVGAEFPLDESMRHVEALCALDRFQASDGIAQAADLCRRGAQAVRVVGGGRSSLPRSVRVVDVGAPRSWTPIRAVLRLDEGPAASCYPEDAMCLATYSAATPMGGVRAPLVAAHRFGERTPAGAVLVVDPRTTTVDEAISIAERGGAVGLVASPLATDSSADLEQARGRIQLPIGTGLLAFSVARAELARLLQAAERGQRVFVEVSTHSTAPMPLVEALLPGTDSGAEILISAHLCHPRPGANDNASAPHRPGADVRAAEGQRRAGATRRGIRFLFGPEFVGTAAYLHDFVQVGRRARPVAVVDLDMIGEDQARCGGPLIVELPPEHLPSIAGALADHCLARLPPDARSYSGAIPLRRWNAVVTPFAGGSDHGVHADRSVAIPSILIGHCPDRFNHTSADAIDKIDPHELRRVSTVRRRLRAGDVDGAP